MATLGQIGALDHLTHHPLDLRHLEHAAGVDLRREEPEEALLANYVAIVGESLDPHIIEIRGSVNGRLGAGLGEVEKPLVVESLTNHGRHRRHCPRWGRSAVDAENSEPGIGHRLDHFVIADSREPVLAVSKENEVIVGKPIE